MFEIYVYTAGAAAMHDYCWSPVGTKSNGLPAEVSSQELRNTKVALNFRDRTATLFIGGMETSRLDFLRRNIYNYIMIVCRSFTKRDTISLQKICAVYLADSDAFARDIDRIIIDDPDAGKGYSADESALMDFINHTAEKLPNLKGAGALKKRACEDTPENRRALAAALLGIAGTSTPATQLLICKFYSPQKYLVGPKWCLYDGIDAELDSVCDFAVKHKRKFGVAAAVIAAIAAASLQAVITGKRSIKKRGVVKHDDTTRTSHSKRG